MNREQYFVEEVGLFFETRGVQRMAGRVMGRLLICDPPHQSAEELAEALMASKGSISTSTRLLMQFGMVEKTSLPGERRDYFIISPNCWNNSLREAQNKITEFRILAEKGLEVIKDKDLQIKQRLETMYDMYAFFDQEWGALVKKWEQQHKN